MAIRMRRGNEADFDPSKMLPGELAVSTDTKYVRMCFSPGIVLRMATYEAFESDMAEIRKILSQCQSIQTAVELIQKNVTNSELVIENYVKEAKQYRDEAEQFRNEAFSTTPEGYEDLVKNVSDNTVKIDTIIEKAELNIKNNAKGSNIHLTDSAESNVVALELYGKTEQNAYTGKNLLDCRGLVEKTNNGVNFTPVYDENGNLEYINVNGTATAQASYYIGKAFVKANEKYLGKGGNSVYTTNYFIYLNGNKYIYKNDKEIVYTEDKNISAQIVVLSGVTVNNDKFYPMISLEGGEYEPYVGGMPSPSPDYPQEIKSVKGKNLLDCRGLTETTINGITFTPVYDENGNLLYINTNGTASANAEFEVKPNLTNTVIDKANSYILSGCPNGGSDTTYRMVYTELDASWGGTGVSNKDNGAGVLLNHTDKVKYSSIRIDIFSGTVCDNLKFYPMIRPASITDATYVPYGLLRIKTHGKNLLDLEAVTKNSTFDASGLINTSSVSSITDFILVSGKENVTISNARNDTYTRIACYYDVNKSFISSEEYSSKKHTFTVPSNAYYMRIAVAVNIENIQLEIGVEATEYQPYQSTEITLSEPIELNGFNGVYDVVTSDGVTRRFAEVVFDGSDDEGWNITSVSNGSRFYIKLNDAKASANVLCTQATISNCGISASLNFYIDIFSQYSSVDELKTHLAENPMTLVYELATPTTEALQTDFTALKTFYPETYVSNDADCDMSITYTADAKNYIDNKIALLTTALYNNI